jgi:hypothetical protein
MNFPIHGKFFLLLCFLSTLFAIPAYGTPNEDFAALIQTALEQRDVNAYLALVSSDPEIQNEQRAYIVGLLRFKYTSMVSRLVDQRPDRILLHLFFQNPNEARFEAWSIQTTLENDALKIRQRGTLSSITGLYKLEMQPDSIPVSKFEIRQQDAVFHLQNGSIFLVMTGDDPAGIVFVGEGTFEFDPKDPIEQQQVELFSKKKTIQTPMEHLYIRSSPDHLKEMLADVFSKPRAANPTVFARAQEIEKTYDPDAFGVKVPLSDELWYPRLERKELFCELKTRFGTLVYQHSPRDVEDVILSLKEKDQIISYYNSTGSDIRISSGDDATILSYDMHVSSNPVSDYISGTARIKIQAEEDLTNIGMRLNPLLRVSQIRSSQGPLLYFQQRETNKLQVVLNDVLKTSGELSLELFYQGRIPSDQGKAEVAFQQQPEANVYVPPTTLYSNQARWYPMLETDPYTAVNISVSVPDGYTAISNGVLTGTEKEDGRTVFSFKSSRPVKYYSLLIGRFDDAYASQSIVPVRVYYYSIDKDLAVEYANNADKILRFFSEYFGEFPYENLTIALRPLLTEGGHAPASLIILNRVYTYFNVKTKRDPMNLPDFPVFLLAHEMAHQWWGQAVGWRTYRDQWLSEGFAQFAATEFVRREMGVEGWEKLSKIFQEWVNRKTDAGPLILGARLGHLENDRQAYTALLYNKGAYVLNMLKLWMGTEAFSKCLMDYFEKYRFQRVGVTEFIQSAQKYSSEDLTPFFKQWLYRWETPVLTVSQKIQEEQLESKVQLFFRQTSSDFFLLKIPVSIKGKKGEVFEALVSVNKPEDETVISVPFRAVSVEVDPEHEVLMKVNQDH